MQQAHTSPTETQYVVELLLDVPQSATNKMVWAQNGAHMCS